MNVGIPAYVAYDSGKGVIVVNLNGSTTSVISDSTNTVIATVSTGSVPGPMVYDSGKGELFCITRGGILVISDSALPSEVPSTTVPEFSSTALILVMAAVVTGVTFVHFKPKRKTC